MRTSASRRRLNVQPLTHDFTCRTRRWCKTAKTAKPDQPNAAHNFVCVTHFLCPLLLRKRGHFLQEIYVLLCACVFGGGGTMYFVSPYAVGIRKSFYLCHSPQFNAHRLFSQSTTLKLHFVTRMLDLPLFKQDRKSRIQ